MKRARVAAFVPGWQPRALAHKVLQQPRARDSSSRDIPAADRRHHSGQAVLIRAQQESNCRLVVHVQADREFAPGPSEHRS